MSLLLIEAHPSSTALIEYCQYLVFNSPSERQVAIKGAATTLRKIPGR